MNDGRTKAQVFVELLPEIYYRKIVLKLKHRDICQWLLDEHGLDFFSEVTDENGNKTVPLFGNYLRRYGNLKKARESYKENIASKLDIENEWWKDYVDENHRPIKPQKLKTPVSKADAMPKTLPTTPERVVEQPKAEHKQEGSFEVESGDTQSIGTERKTAPNNQTGEQSEKGRDPTKVLDVLGIKDKTKTGVDYNKIDPLEWLDKRNDGDFLDLLNAKKK